MKISVFESKNEMGKAAAAWGAQQIRAAIQKRGCANIIVATGASQFEVLEALTQEPDIAWNRVTGFHLDEYVGLSLKHPASFRKYLWERFVSQLPYPMQSFHFLDGEDDCKKVCQQVGAELAEHPIDCAFVGIGENGHLAFNDPPANFDTQEPYIIVELDEACRRQQYGEGWFETMDEVPRTAISMSVQQILKSRSIVCTVPDQRKAQAVQQAVEGEVTPDVPASILRQHENTQLYLDSDSSSMLSQR